MPCAICGETEFTVILRPGALFRFVCPKCKAPTYVYVSEKLEVIMVREDELCPECGGTGRCGSCGGTGKSECPRCGGRGWIYDDNEYFYYPCPYCGGSLKEPDFLSSSFEEFMKRVFMGGIKLGSGKGECPECRGSGVCPKCHGLRFKPRPLRGGKG